MDVQTLSKLMIYVCISQGLETHIDFNFLKNIYYRRFLGRLKEISELGNYVLLRILHWNAFDY